MSHGYRPPNMQQTPSFGPAKDERDYRSDHEITNDYLSDIYNVLKSIDGNVFNLVNAIDRLAETVANIPAK